MAGSRSAHTVTIRWSLVRNLFLLIVFLSGMILLTTIYTGRQVRREMSRALIERAVGRVESDLAAFFAPVQRSLLLARDLLEAGVLDIDDPDGLNRVFAPLIQEIPQISSINIGAADGRGYLLLRFPDRWRNRFVWTDRWGPRLEYREWRSPTQPGTAWTVEDPSEDERYDPRTRAWYRVAIEAPAALEPGVARPARVYWTKAYRFFTTRDPGITAMVHVDDARGRRFVLAFDVLLRDLSSFTQQLDVSANGFGFVVDADRALLGLPDLPEFRGAEARAVALLERPADVGSPLLSAGVEALRARLRNLPDELDFAVGGERYWMGSRPMSLGANRELRVVVGVPERDLLGPVAELRFLVAGAALAGFAAALAMAFWLGRRYGAPLAALARNSQRIGALELADLPPVESGLREVNQLAEEQERMRVALDSFSRYVPVEIVRELMTRGEAARIGGSSRVVTALFTDVRGFTSISESLSPEALAKHMAEYFEELLGIVQGDGCGTVTQLNGDGMIALWGAPLDDSEHASHAVHAVVRCQRRLRELDAEWRDAGRPELPTRFGLATGPAVIGNVGSRSRLVYTAMGDTINLASRLEALGRFYGVSALAAGTTRDAAGTDLAWRHVDAVRVKGRHQPVEIFELLGFEAAVDADTRRFAVRYEAALGAFRGAEFATAVAALEALEAERPGDLSLWRLLERARRCASQPPGAEWDAVSDFDVK